MLLVSVFLALLSTPILIRLERKGVPSSLAVMIIMAGIITLLLMSVAVIGASLKLPVRSVAKLSDAPARPGHGTQALVRKQAYRAHR